MRRRYLPFWRRKQGENVRGDDLRFLNNDGLRPPVVGDARRSQPRPRRAQERSEIRDRLCVRPEREREVVCRDVCVGGRGAASFGRERERKSFFFIQEVENKQNKKKLATGTRPLSLTHFSFLSTHRQRSSSRESTSRKMAAYLTASLGGRRKAGSFLRVSWRRAAASEEEEEEAVHAGGDGGGVSSDACCFILRETRSFPAAETTAPLLPSLPRREKKPAGCCKNERSRNQRPRRGRLIERESRRPP